MPDAIAAPLQPVAVASVAPPALVGAVSRKVHGSAGTFDLALSLDPAAPTVEPRQGASTTIVFSFDKPITAANAAVTEGTASVLGSAISGHDVAVELGGVANEQWVTLTLSNVTSGDGGSGGGGAVRIGLLRGDVSGNRVVTVSDLAQVNAQIAQVVGAGNFLRDVNANGTLTVADKGIANTQITKASPPIGNQAPAVSAGADQATTLPAAATLGGAASDDGLPAPAALSLAWTKASGPGTVTFGSPDNASTSASFSEAGIYGLRLLASDGALVAGDEVQVTVHPQGGTLNAPLPVPETGRAVSATIGSAGGTVSATAADGTTYQLDVPPGALPGPVTITMTPVASVGGLPLSGGLLGAVDLKPTGLRLARTALLRIGKPGTPPGGLTLTGFGLATGAAAVTRSPAVARSGEVAVLLTHFSTHGAGFGTTQDLETLELSGRDRSESEGTAFEEAVWEVLFHAHLHTPEEIRAAYLRYFDEVVLPMLQRAATDIELLDAAAEYVDWLTFVTYVDGTPAADAVVAAIDSAFFATLYPRKTNWELLAVTKFRAAVDANNALCRSEQSLAALRNVLFLQSTAAFVVSSDLLSANGLDRPAVLSNLCAKLLITNLSLADPLQSTVPSDMDATFGLQFDGQVEVQAVPVRVEFIGENATFNKTSPANSDLLGGFPLGVTAIRPNEGVRVFIRGCMVLLGEVSDVCVDDELFRNLPRFDGTIEWVGTITVAMEYNRDRTLLDGFDRERIGGIATFEVGAVTQPGVAATLSFSSDILDGTAEKTQDSTETSQSEGCVFKKRYQFSGQAYSTDDITGFGSLVVQADGRYVLDIEADAGFTGSGTSTRTESLTAATSECALEPFVVVDAQTVSYNPNISANSGNVLGTAGVADFSGTLAGSAHRTFSSGAAAIKEVTITWNLRRR